jgi:hypothetical protein
MDKVYKLDIWISNWVDWMSFRFMDYLCANHELSSNWVNLNAQPWEILWARLRNFMSRYPRYSLRTGAHKNVFEVTGWAWDSRIIRYVIRWSSQLKFKAMRILWDWAINLMSRYSGYSLGTGAHRNVFELTRWSWDSWTVKFAIWLSSQLKCKAMRILWDQTINLMSRYPGYSLGTGAHRNVFGVTGWAWDSWTVRLAIGWSSQLDGPVMKEFTRLIHEIYGLVVHVLSWGPSTKHAIVSLADLTRMIAE